MTNSQTHSCSNTPCGKPLFQPVPSTTGTPTDQHKHQKPASVPPTPHGTGENPHKTAGQSLFHCSASYGGGAGAEHRHLRSRTPTPQNGGLNP